MEEFLRQQREMERAMGKTQLDLLVHSRIHDEIRRASQYHRLIEEHLINTSQSRRLIEESIRAAQRDVIGGIVSGIDKAARESMAKAIVSLSGPAMEAARRSMAEAVGAFAQAASKAYQDAAYSSIKALASSFPRELLDRLAQTIAGASRIDLTKLGAIAGSGAFAGLDYSKFNPALAQIQALQSSYAGQVAAALRNVLLAQDISDENINRLQNLVDSKVESLPQGRISAEGLLTLLLALIGVILSYGSYQVAVNQSASSDKTSEKQTGQLEHITDLLQQLVEHTEKLLPNEDKSTYYVVEREVTLRLKPTSKAAPLVVLLPNQSVRLVQRKHKWIYVEYFDEIEGVPKYGWAQKKYLKQLSGVLHGGQFYSQRRRDWDDVSESLDREERQAITENWDQVNARRVELIHKKVDNNITPEEEDELNNLQRLADERIRQLAPLPVRSLESALEDIKRRTK